MANKETHKNGMRESAKKHEGHAKGYIFSISVILLTVVLISLLSSMSTQLKNDRVAGVLREGVRTAPYLFDDVGQDFVTLLPYGVEIAQVDTNTTDIINVSISDAFPLPQTPDSNFTDYESFFENTFAAESGYTLNLSTGINQSKCKFDDGMNYTRTGDATTNDVTLLLGAADANEWGQAITVTVSASSTSAPTPMTSDSSGVNVTLIYRDMNNSLTQNILVNDSGAGKSVVVPFAGGQTVGIYFVKVGSADGMRVRANSSLVLTERMDVLLNTTAQPSYTFDNLTLTYSRGNVSRSGSIYVGG